MAIPFDLITPAPVFAAFRPPADEDYTPLSEGCIGGTAVGDGAAGRETQRFTAEYDGNAIQVYPESGPSQFTLVRLGVLTVSLAFDSNMAVALAYKDGAGCHLHYFDSVLGNYTTRDFPLATSCRCCTDDNREFNNAASDVIFAYTQGNVLYYRQQRDRYNVEYLVGSSNDLDLLRVGQNTLNRLQFKLGTYIPPLAP